MADAEVEDMSLPAYSANLTREEKLLWTECHDIFGVTPFDLIPRNMEVVTQGKGLNLPWSLRMYAAFRRLVHCPALVGNVPFLQHCLWVAVGRRTDSKKVVPSRSLVPGKPMALVHGDATGIARLAGTLLALSSDGELPSQSRMEDSI